MKGSILVAVATVLMMVSSARAQQVDVHRYVELVGAGQLEEVRKDLPALIAGHPDDPGVIYLQGLTAADGADAVRLYQSIVDNHPRSEWADDALYKVSQFYQALGLVRTAELKMAQLRREYPTSKYVTGNGQTAEVALSAPSSGVSGGSAAADTTPPPVSKAAPAKRGSPAAARPGAKTPAGTGQGAFALQVGAFSTEVNAARVRRQFAGAGYPADILRRVRDGRTMYLVWVGHYRTEEEARSHVAEIREKQSIASIVVAR